MFNRSSRHQNKHISSSTSNNIHSKAAGTRPERVQCESLFLVFAGQGLDINAYSYHIKNHFSETRYLFTFPLFGPAWLIKQKGDCFNVRTTCNYKQV